MFVLTIGLDLTAQSARPTSIRNQAAAQFNPNQSKEKPPPEQPELRRQQKGGIFHQTNWSGRSEGKGRERSESLSTNLRSQLSSESQSPMPDLSLSLSRGIRGSSGRPGEGDEFDAVGGGAAAQVLGDVARAGGGQIGGEAAVAGSGCGLWLVA